ncbi:hypothetical protein FRUB_00721 [Fimbriiglobus ruber]|uniref:Uncharacterized protein n=2 Tax=Fimbriiglobus ruber TaxID=1908690 RepID=A0A225E0C9_9BACT|nr:hypothetical protein FRUB_00721 [Fimbriiglobus ruber]
MLMVGFVMFGVAGGLATLAGCGGSASTTEKKMGDGKMDGDKMGGDKMGDKMGGDKMGGDKMGTHK